MHAEERSKQGLGGGIVAGLFAGFVLSVFLAVMSLLKGQDVWMVMKGAGLPFLLERATQPGFDALAVLVGVLCHFGVSIAWGALFGVLFYGMSRGATIAWGLVWGVVVWIGMYYVVLPLVGADEVAQHVPVSTAVLQHVLFGAALAVGFLPYQRLVVREARPPTQSGIPLPH